MPIRLIAYLPLVTHPEPVKDEAVSAAIQEARLLGAELHVSTFAVDIPDSVMPTAGLLLSIPNLIRTAEEHSREHCRRLASLVNEEAGRHGVAVECSLREVLHGEVGNSAAQAARYFDVALMPWSKQNLIAQDVAQSVIFGSGRPTILSSETSVHASHDQVAIAWDGSRVAARALADALRFLRHDVRVSVITVHDEKRLPESDLAQRLCNSLQARGLVAEPVISSLNGRPIGTALQESALEAGASLLVMGGFGHSRLRDFVLGGATRDVLSEQKMAVCLSH